MEKIINFRELAKGLKNKDGMQIAENTIFRSGIVSHASEKDIDRLVRYGIRYIYDFRSDDEVKKYGPLPADLFESKQYDILQDASLNDLDQMADYSKEDIVQVMVGMYRDSFSQTSGYRPVLAQIAAQRTPGFLFHCSAGKDRTGVFGAILMMILDFDIDTIKEEYLRIDTVSLRYVKKDVLTSTGLIEHENVHIFDNMFTVLPEYLEAYLEEIEKQHQDYDDYLLQRFGVSAILKQRFKDRYLK